MKTVDNFDLTPELAREIIDDITDTAITAVMEATGLDGVAARVLAVVLMSQSLGEGAAACEFEPEHVMTVFGMAFTRMSRNRPAPATAGNKHSN